MRKTVYADFNLRLAKLDGWEFESVEDAYGDGNTGYIVTDPDGRKIEWWHSAGKTYMKVWPASSFEESYPNYLHDSDYAFRLKVDGFKLHVEQDGVEWIAYYTDINGYSDSSEPFGTASGKTPSEAICESRIALDDIMKKLKM